LDGLATGVWKDKEEAAAAWQAERTFTPGMAAGEREVALSRWRDAVGRA
jgi:glycerol kinase